MPAQPEFERFRTLLADHDAVPVVRQVLADQLTPVSAFSRIDNGGDACLFESVIGGEQVGRYSILACQPHRQFVARRDHITTVESGKTHSERVANPLKSLRAMIQAVKVAKLPELPPFTGGAVGFAGYDTIRYVEDLPNPPPDDRGIPDMAFGFYDCVLVFDNINKTLSIIALAWKHAFDKPLPAYEDACQRIDQILQQLNRPGVELATREINSLADEPPFTSNTTLEQFMAHVEKCVEYIRAGDIFQVVISQRLQVEIKTSPFEIYRQLRVLNPSPFMFFLRCGGVTLVGASPEIMCRVIGNEMTVRPLAGTRPRGRTQQQDMELEQELLSDDKERAEHAMLVDLGRNDVGKVCEFGSVELIHPFSIERYSHVMHISSTVKGNLKPGLDEFDALMASHPAGTVSGAPKVRAMQIIDEMEPHRRGPYAGAIGYIDYSGDMDTCIALRTIVIQGHTAYVQAGAGVVADSDPAAEYQETLNKAKALLRAIQAAESPAAESPAAESTAATSRADESRAGESRAGESRAGESPAGE